MYYQLCTSVVFAQICWVLHKCHTSKWEVMRLECKLECPLLMVLNQQINTHHFKSAGKMKQNQRHNCLTCKPRIGHDLSCERKMWVGVDSTVSWIALAVSVFSMLQQEIYFQRAKTDDWCDVYVRVCGRMTRPVERAEVGKAHLWWHLPCVTFWVSAYAIWDAVKRPSM